MGQKMAAKGTKKNGSAIENVDISHTHTGYVTKPCIPQRSDPVIMVVPKTGISDTQIL